MKYCCERCLKAIDGLYDKKKCALLEYTHSGYHETLMLCEKCYEEFKKFIYEKETENEKRTD